MAKKQMCYTLEEYSHRLVSDVMEKTGIKYKSQAQDLINKVIQCEVSLDTILYYYTTCFNSKEYGKKEVMDIEH